MIPASVHAGWLAAQMMRWGHIPADVDIPALAARVYRPDLFDTAAAALGLPATAPLESLKGYGTAGEFRLADARRHAAQGPLSRIVGA